MIYSRLYQRLLQLSNKTSSSCGGGGVCVHPSPCGGGDGGHPSAAAPHLRGDGDGDRRCDGGDGDHPRASAHHHGDGGDGRPCDDGGDGDRPSSCDGGGDGDRPSQCDGDGVRPLRAWQKHLQKRGRAKLQ